MARGRAANGSGLQPRLRADGRWEARYQVGTDPTTGKAIKRSVYAATSEECAKKLRAAVAAIDAGTYIDPSRMTVSQWLEIWLNEYYGAIKPGTRKTYSDTVRRHIAPALGRFRLCALQPHDVQRFVNALQQGARPLSAKTVKNIHGTLCKALSEACRVKYIASNPASGCILPKAVREELHPLEEAEIIAFTNAIRGNPSENLFFVALNTGMRLSELLGLRWSRIDFRRGTIKVDSQMLVKRGKDASRTLAPPKNNKPRTFTVAPAVMDRLQSVRDQQAQWKANAGKVWQNTQNLVFTNEAGEGVPHATIEHRFARVLAAAGIEKRRFHDLRHTFTVESIRAGVDVKTLSEMLGHSSVSFTLDVYGHVTNTMQAEAAERLQTIITRRIDPEAVHE